MMLRQRARRAAALAALAAGLAALGLGGAALARQEATPAAAPSFAVGQLAPLGRPFELLPGVDIELINEGPAVPAPGHNVVLYRVTFRGGEVPAHIHPGTTVLTVESGTLSWTLLAGAATVTRAGAAPETVSAPGTEVVVNAGEGLAYNADVVHTARAGGDQPAEVLVASLWAVGQPAFTLTDEHGAPVAVGTPAP